MVSFQPFRGYVYNREQIEASGSLLTAPPYDVLTPAQRESYYRSHEYNFLHVDLGRVLPGDQDPMAWHERSGRLLREWLAKGVLVRVPGPSFVLMETDWTHPISGERLTRHGFLGLMRLEEPSREARVRLHEQTFSFHKMERLDLMLKTQAQLSPIFGFIPDVGNRCLNYLYSLSKGRDPDISLTDSSGEAHRVYLLDRPEEISFLGSSMADSTVYIADGHHRYMTALNYRREILDRIAREGGPEPPKGSALDHVMTYICPMADPGLCVLPTHRIVKCLSISNGEILRRLSPFAEIKCLPFSDGGKDRALARLTTKLAEDSRKGLTVFGLLLSGADHFCFVKVREKVKEALADDAPSRASLSLLDVSILTNVILKEALSLTEELMDDPECISYVSQVPEALELLGAGNRAAFILNPTSLNDILRVTESGYVMPRKATYFFPKVRNGLVINVVDPMEALPGARGLGGSAKTAC
jgi:uncharacterized protein (DUF1015 family)